MNHTIINENALLKVNLSFLSDNYNYLRNCLKDSRIGCVLKSDAYGLGLINVTKKLIKIGCSDFFLTSLDETLKVRKECRKSKATPSTKNERMHSKQRSSDRSQGLHKRVPERFDGCVVVGLARLATIGAVGRR